MDTKEVGEPITEADGATTSFLYPEAHTRRRLVSR